MVMMGVAIVGMLSPPSMRHPWAALMISRYGAGPDRAKLGRPGRTAPVACARSHAARGGVGQAAGVQLPSGVLLAEHHDHRSRLACGQRPTRGPGPGRAAGVGACPAGPPEHEWVVSIESRPLRRGWEAIALLHTIGGHRACRQPPRTRPSRVAPYRLGWSGRTSSSSSTSQSAASPPASCTAHHHPRVPATLNSYVFSVFCTPVPAPVRRTHGPD
jgi:hypothetical protein